MRNRRLLQPFLWPRSRIKVGGSSPPRLPQGSFGSQNEARPRRLYQNSRPCQSTTTGGWFFLSFVCPIETKRMKIKFMHLWRQILLFPLTPTSLSFFLSAPFEHCSSVEESAMWDKMGLGTQLFQPFVGQMILSRETIST